MKDETIKRAYSIVLERNIGNITTMDDLEEYASEISKAIKNAAESIIPARKASRKPYISEEILKLADEKRKLRLNKNISDEHARLYKDLCRKVKKSVRQDKENWIQNNARKLTKVFRLVIPDRHKVSSKSLRTNLYPN